MKLLATFFSKCNKLEIVLGNHRTTFIVNKKRWSGQKNTGLKRTALERKALERKGRITRDVKENGKRNRLY